MSLLPLGTCLLNAPSHSQLHRAWVDARMYSDLDIALDEIGTAYKTLAIPAPQTANRNGTVTSNIQLLFLEGGSIDTNSKTITINGPIKAPTSQIFAGSGTVNFGSGSQESAWPEWWGTAEGVLQKAIDATEGKHIPIKLLGNGTYLFDSTLTIDEDYTMIEGPSFPTQARRTGWESGIGATLRYTGTATGILIGDSPDVNGTYVTGIQLKNFLLMVTQDANIAMRTWHPYGCEFRNISIFGNSDDDDSSNIGLKVEASQYTTFDHIDINGAGIDDTGWLGTECLGYGIYHTVGYNDTVPTTTDYNHIYAHYCDIGIYQNYWANFSNTIIESTKGLQGAEFGANARGKWDNCWFEDNNNTCVRFAGADGFLRFSNTHFNHGTKNKFFRGANHSGKLRFDACRFASVNANPQIFENLDAWTGEYVFDQCEFLYNTTMYGTGGGAKLGWHLASIENMQMDVLRFLGTNIAANTYYRSLPRGDGFIGERYRMPQKGNIIGLNTCYRKLIGIVKTGTYIWTVSANGANEYYCTDLGGTNPNLSDPESVWQDDFPGVEGILGTLATQEWGYGDNDSLGFNTVYARLSDETDPDTKSDDYVQHIGKQTAGNYAVHLKKNDDYIWSFDYPSPGFQTGDLIWNEDFLKTRFVAGDWLNFQFNTDASFAPIGGDMAVEVMVAYGDDGMSSSSSSSLSSSSSSSLST